VKKFRFDPDQDIPLVSARLRGPRGSKVVRLVLDTGCGLTQINTPMVEAIGYSAADASQIVTTVGPAGPMQTGYSIGLGSLEVLGRLFADVRVAAYDMDNSLGLSVDGLLGFDLIKKFHLEMNGPSGELVIF
jgi:hypothetical protein